MKHAAQHDQIETLSPKRIAAAQRWLSDRVIEARRAGFYGEITVNLKFEAGHCVLFEQIVRETVKNPRPESGIERTPIQPGESGTANASLQTSASSRPLHGSL